MSPILILEATGPRAEALAMAAGENRGIAVGFDPEFRELHVRRRRRLRI